MDAIAEAAEVGKGTVFRRFGDRASLLRSLIDETEREFQEGFIRGPAPLGPGAPPLKRLVAFGHALMDRLESTGELLLAAETGSAGARFIAGVYGAYRAHLVALLRAGGSDVDPDYAADALLAALSAEVFMYQRRGRGVALERLKEGWAQLASALLG